MCLSSHTATGGWSNRPYLNIPAGTIVLFTSTGIGVVQLLGIELVVVRAVQSSGVELVVVGAVESSGIELVLPLSSGRGSTIIMNRAKEWEFLHRNEFLHKTYNYGRLLRKTLMKDSYGRLL